MGTHLNCINKSVQFKWVYSFELHRQVNAVQMGTHKICLYKEVDKNFTGCNLKTTELVDCAPIVVCAVIGSNMINNFGRDVKHQIIVVIIRTFILHLLSAVFPEIVNRQHCHGPNCVDVQAFWYLC